MSSSSGCKSKIIALKSREWANVVRDVLRLLDLSLKLKRFIFFLFSSTCIPMLENYFINVN